MDLEEEKEAIRAAQADPQRFTVLYERYFGDIFRFVLRRTGTTELTNDLVQDTFLKAMLALPRYQDRGLPFRAWLYRIAFNEVRMHWRKRKEVVVEIDRLPAMYISEEVGLVADEAELQRLAGAMGRLDRSKARLIELRYMDGMSFAELGAVLGIAEDAAKMRTHRALAILRTYLGPRA
jgi:RNA polymerase sigma-70 factor (ECF subfamily)